MNNISASDSGHHHAAPNPPPRIHSRPNQPPPPPPLPSVPPVPPTRDSSIAMSKATIISNEQTNSALMIPQAPAVPPATQPSFVINSPSNTSRVQPDQPSPAISHRFLNDFEHSFTPINELPAPEPFMNKHKTYPSQKGHSSNREKITHIIAETSGFNAV